ncbi:dynein axonemal assembly factor 10 [Neocloeon triangulifer]|uniref:dynein axonemal assembly factor 10 n=1 Tax=Neocloeon triangulifer TaxID=2078957 RepID=UPI00286F621F|nr:dynein axonemal assembly factor 10 [Neocloeon triangulifer]
MDKSQLVCLLEKSLTCSVFDVKWIPCSAKFVVLGCLPRSTGTIKIFELNGSELTLIKEAEKPKALKCGTFGASSLRERRLATGDFDGNLSIWDLEDFERPVYTVKAHKELINAVAGFGGQNIGCGAPEIATCGRDGIVKLWDPRQREVPVAVMKAKEGETPRDCWAVAFGNSFNNDERVIASGYDNGDIKMFDLRKMQVQWETNLANGVCDLHFDRPDIEMNKLVATTLEAKFHVFDLRTQHPTRGFAYMTEEAHKSTIWCVRHLPQNREVFATTGGAGSVHLWKYEYPAKRFKEDSEGVKEGVPGSVTLLHNATLSTQPISSFDWSPDKLGLGVCASFDQTVRVLVATKLNLL